MVDNNLVKTRKKGDNMKCILTSYIDLYDIYAINNGSYILIDDKNYLYGEAYLIKNGKIEKINEDDKVIIL